MMYRTIAGVMLALGLAMAAGSAAAADQAKPVTPYGGLKKTVSVDPFLATEALGGIVTSDGMTALLTAALVKDGHFVVVERTGLMGVQAEQALGQVGGAIAETAAKAGQLIGASAIVRGVVTKFGPAASGSSLTIGGPLGRFFATRAGLQSQTSVIDISLRLIDTTTGQVMSTFTAQGSASSTTADANIVNTNSGAGLGGNAFKNTPIGQAGEQAIVKAVEHISNGMRNIPWSALVVDVNGGTVYVNAGAEQNVQVGLVLNVYRKGKVFTDPATGVVLDVVMEKIGAIRIDGVREKLSTATVVSGETPVRGNLLKLN